jgi:hypothetical protein
VYPRSENHVEKIGKAAVKKGVLNHKFLFRFGYVVPALTGRVLRVCVPYPGAIEESRKRECSEELHICVCLWSLVLCDDVLSLLSPYSHTHTRGVGVASAWQYCQGGGGSGCRPCMGLVAHSMSGDLYWSAGEAYMGVFPSGKQGLEPKFFLPTNPITLLGCTFKGAIPHGPTKTYTITNNKIDTTLGSTMSAQLELQRAVLLLPRFQGVGAGVGIGAGRASSIVQLSSESQLKSDIGEGPFGDSSQSVRSWGGTMVL